MSKIRISTFSLAALALATSSALYARESVNKSLEADAKSTVEINIVRGVVVIEGVSDNKVSVQGELDEQTKEFIFERDGNAITIEVRLPRNLHGDDDDASDLRIKLPRTANLKFKGVSTDVSVREIAGESAISTVSGELHASRLGHDVSLASVSGDIELKGAGNEVSISTVSGNVSAHVTSKELSASSVSGDVSIHNEGSAKDLSVSTVSGDAKVISALDKGVEVSMSSVSGRLELNAKGEVNARIDANTGPGGDILNDLSDDKPKTSFVGDEHLRIKLGDGSGDISLSVVSGEIVLRKN